MSSSLGLDGDIVHIARENILFRKVVHTGECSQLVVMSVPPGGEVGMEHYPHTDLIFFILKAACLSTSWDILVIVQCNGPLWVAASSGRASAWVHSEI
jgi:hypothetical protein